jgi:hypothetical protein
MLKKSISEIQPGGDPEYWIDPSAGGTKDSLKGDAMHRPLTSHHIEESFSQLAPPSIV